MVDALDITCALYKRVPINGDKVRFLPGSVMDAPSVCGLQIMRGKSVVLDRTDAIRLRDWLNQWLEETK